MWIMEPHVLDIFLNGFLLFILKFGLNGKDPAHIHHGFLMGGFPVFFTSTFPSMPPMPTTAVSNEKTKEPGRIRHNFPETWLWTNASTGYNNSNNFTPSNVIIFGIVYPFTQ